MSDLGFPDIGGLTDDELKEIVSLKKVSGFAALCRAFKKYCEELRGQYIAKRPVGDLTDEDMYRLGELFGNIDRIERLLDISTRAETLLTNRQKLTKEKK